MATQNAQAVISVDLGGTKIYGIVHRRDGTIICERTTATHRHHADVFTHLTNFIHALQADAAQHGIVPTGIAIGVPGIVHQNHVIAAPAVEWQDEPVGKKLTAHFELPVIIENDVNLAALGEYRYGAAQGASSLICVAVGTGIGAGIVINGALYKGAHDSAGEIGYMTVDPAQFHNRYAHAEFGAFEALASGSGIANRAQRAAPAKHHTAESVMMAATHGEAWARQVIDETVLRLTLGLTSITAILDPEVIVLTGGVMQNAAFLAEDIRTHMKRLIPFHPRIAVSSLGPRATAFGAAELLWSTLG